VYAEGLKALLVCISCHGHRYDDDGNSPRGLHLAMSDSDMDLPGSYLRFDEVSQLLGQAARARDGIPHVMLVVDACMSDGEKADDSQGGGAAGIDHLAVPGVVTLTATKQRVIAWPHWRDTKWTAFLGAMIDSVEAGIPGPRRILTARDIFGAAQARLARAREKEQKIPEPRINIEGLSEIPLCRNSAYIEPAVVTSGETGPEPASFADADSCFAAIRAAHRAGGGSIPAIVRRFCGPDGPSVGEAARLVAKLGKSEFSNYVADGYTAACSGQAAAHISAFAHGLHSNAMALDAPRLLSSLGPDPGPMAREVYLSMRRSRCADCAEAAGVVSAAVISEPRVAAEALALWQ
jgi:hypothetical protein